MGLNCHCGRCIRATNTVNLQSWTCGWQRSLKVLPWPGPCQVCRMSFGSGQMDVGLANKVGGEAFSCPLLKQWQDGVALNAFGSGIKSEDWKCVEIPILVFLGFFPSWTKGWNVHDSGGWSRCNLSLECQSWARSRVQGRRAGMSDCRMCCGLMPFNNSHEKRISCYT